LHKWQSATVTLQAWVRGRQQRALFQRVLKAVSRLQGWFRKCLTEMQLLWVDDPIPCECLALPMSRSSQAQPRKSAALELRELSAEVSTGISLEPTTFSDIAALVDTKSMARRFHKYAVHTLRRSQTCPEADFDIGPRVTHEGTSSNLSFDASLTAVSRCPSLSEPGPSHDTDAEQARKYSYSNMLSEASLTEEASLFSEVAAELAQRPSLARQYHRYAIFSAQRANTCPEPGPPCIREMSAHEFVVEEESSEIETLTSVGSELDAIRENIWSRMPRQTQPNATLRSQKHCWLSSFLNSSEQCMPKVAGNRTSV